MSTSFALGRSSPLLSQQRGTSFRQAPFTLRNNGRPNSSAAAQIGRCPRQNQNSSRSSVRCLGVKKQIPIFPLSVVALPHAVVPLMIFEARWVDSGCGSAFAGVCHMCVVPQAGITRQGWFRDRKLQPLCHNLAGNFSCAVQTAIDPLADHRMHGWCHSVALLQLRPTVFEQPTRHMAEPVSCSNTHDYTVQCTAPSPQHCSSARHFRRCSRLAAQKPAVLHPLSCALRFP
jgi:hypothetical protein